MIEKAIPTTRLAYMLVEAMAQVYKHSDPDCIVAENSLILRMRTELRRRQTLRLQGLPEDLCDGK